MLFSKIFSKPMAVELPIFIILSEPGGCIDTIFYIFSKPCGCLFYHCVSIYLLL